MIDSNGWTHVGYYGFNHIYAKGDIVKETIPSAADTWFSKYWKENEFS